MGMPVTSRSLSAGSSDLSDLKFKGLPCVQDEKKIGNFMLKFRSYAITTFNINESV